MTDPFSYPQSRTDDVADVLHGHTIADPYRWLEDPDSAQTADWVRRQNEFSRSVLDQLPERAWFADVVDRVVRRPRSGIPSCRGGRWYVSRNDGSHDQDQLFTAATFDELRAGGELIIDPNTWSPDGTRALSGWSVSDDGRLLSVQISDGGSDWVEFQLLDAATGEPVEDAPLQSRFSHASWLPDSRSSSTRLSPTAVTVTARMPNACGLA